MLLPPAPPTSIAATPRSRQHERRLAADARAGFFRDHRHAHCGDDPAHGGDDAFGAAIAFGLGRLLQEIQVQRQGAGTDHGDGTVQIVKGECRFCVLRDELWRTNICDQEGGRRLLAGHGTTGSGGRIHQGGTLAAHAHREVKAFRRPRQALVDDGDAGIPARQ